MTLPLLGRLRLYCPVTTITSSSSSELSPPFIVLGCLSGWVRAAPKRLEVGLLKWGRKFDVEELELGVENPPDPGRRGVGNILDSGSKD